MLSDKGILNAMSTGLFNVHPLFDPSMLQPASIDIRLAGVILREDIHQISGVIDPQVEQPMVATAFNMSTYTLPPGQLVLGSTVEWLTFSDRVAGRIEGKSSLGRLGLLIHSTAGFIDPGFSGNLTLEIVNVASRPILLRPGMRIGQVCLFMLDQPCAVPYGSPQLFSKYQHQQGPVASRAWKERT